MKSLLTIFTVLVLVGCSSSSEPEPEPEVKNQASKSQPNSYLPTYRGSYVYEEEKSWTVSTHNYILGPGDGAVWWKMYPLFDDNPDMTYPYVLCPSMESSDGGSWFVDENSRPFRFRDWETSLGDKMSVVGKKINAGELGALYYYIPEVEPPVYTYLSADSTVWIFQPDTVKITVPAGTFRCLGIVRDMGTYSEENYYSRGVGLVLSKRTRWNERDPYAELRLKQYNVQ